MNLQAITNGSVTGTGTMATPDGLVGGILITADGTNDATVVIRRDNSSGKQIFKLVTKIPQMIVAPISTEGTLTCYYSISGTGAAAQFYEWNQ